MACVHKNFSIIANVIRLDDVRPSQASFIAEITITCEQCGIPMRFLGLPYGLDFSGAAKSADGTEVRLAIAPKGELTQDIEEGKLSGFSIRKHYGEQP